MNSKQKLKNWLKKLTHKSKTQSNNEVESPWSEYEELSLLPLEELEKMVEEQLAKEQKEKAEKLSEVSLTTNKEHPHVADLSQNHPNPPLIQCYTTDEDQDPNLRITHYPPSNSLH